MAPKRLSFLWRNLSRYSFSFSAAFLLIALCNLKTHPTSLQLFKCWILCSDTFNSFLSFYLQNDLTRHCFAVFGLLGKIVCTSWSDNKGGGLYYRDLGLGFWGRLVLRGLRIWVLGGHVLQMSLDSPNFAGNGWVAGHRLWWHLKLRVRP